ncbi:MAG: HAD family hydrolase [Eggerthellaceae bacterium]|jgi:phosphoglycolate phosphatase
MAELRTVVFDFDGTLHDSMLIYPAAFRAGYQWLVDHGWAEPQTFTDADISGYIGLTAKEMWTSFRPDLPDDVWPQAAAEVGRTMDRLILDGTARLFPGIPEMLDRVKALGVQLVFLSNCRVAYQEAARTAFGLDRWFSGYYNSEAWHGLPKPKIFEDIARDFPGGYAMVGDRNKDMAVSRVHGFPGVGCLFGYGSREELSDADYYAETPDEVVSCLRQIKRAYESAPARE